VRPVRGESQPPERAAAGPGASATAAGRTWTRLATSLERDADAAGTAFDREAPLAAGAIEPGPLRGETRPAAERTLGEPLGDVRVHTGPAAAAAAQRASATAFALGTDVVVGARGT